MKLRIFILLCLATYSLTAMENNNNNIQTSYVTYESNEKSGDACILHVPKSKFKEEKDMTFVYKKGSKIEEHEALKLLQIDKRSLYLRAQISIFHFLRNMQIKFEDHSTDYFPGSKFIFICSQFKKPNVRIIKKTAINCEQWGLVGEAVDTDFLQLRLFASFVIAKRSHECNMYFYISNSQDNLTLIPYKVAFPSSPKIRADKKVSYF